MGSFFRSEKMVLAQLFIQTESSCKIISELGRLGVCQFIDLNSDLSVFRRKFVNVVKRCHRMEDNLTSIEEGIENAGIKLTPKVKKLKIITLSELMHLEITISETDVELKRLIKCYQDLQSTYLTLLEMQYTLESSKTIFDEIYRSQNGGTDENNDDSEANTNRFDDDFDFIAGVIDRKRYDTFERVLWRLSRGNIFIGRQPIVECITDPVTNQPMYKDCFVVFFKGALIKTKIKKLCDGFKITVYPCPKSVEERNRVVHTVESRVHDLRIIIRQSKVVLNGYLNTIAVQIPFWRENVIRIKAVYHIINGFHSKVGGSYLIGECWLPERDVDLVRETLNQCKQESGSYVDSFLNIIETERMPPTMFKTNKFTICFQNIINAYGILSYEETNPALFSIVTFPFLFGVMFGDCGHAIILILFALWMILKENSFNAANGHQDNEIYQNFYNGRYLILMMGIFSFYAGLMYNEVFSQSINVFGSSWTVNLTKQDILTHEEEFFLHPNRDHSHAYIIGIDPVWEFAENKIIFQNSLKMKLSIILGVFHMIFGVCVSITNHIHFKNYENIVFDFLPQILLLCTTFLWLVCMIFLKWFMFSAHFTEIHYGTGCAPSILIFFIDMMLFKTTEKIKADCEVYMFSFQHQLQQVLYTIYILSIPWMLFGKSIYHGLKKIIHKNQSARKHVVGDHDEGFVYQAIHTIEFVLGTVSHTASYLRLWALSLAHSQLSEVLWKNILQNAFGRSYDYLGIIFVVVGFGLWMFFTVTILIVMEGLSAFLHTLRLHWVEFMSKFYKGGGHTFHPFDLNSILKEDMQVTYIK